MPIAKKKRGEEEKEEEDDDEVKEEEDDEVEEEEAKEKEEEVVEAEEVEEEDEMEESAKEEKSKKRNAERTAKEVDELFPEDSDDEEEGAKNKDEAKDSESGSEGSREDKSDDGKRKSKEMRQMDAPKGKRKPKSGDAKGGHAKAMDRNESKHAEEAEESAAGTMDELYWKAQPPIMLNRGIADIAGFLNKRRGAQEVAIKYEAKTWMRKFLYDILRLRESTEGGLVHYQAVFEKFVKFVLESTQIGVYGANLVDITKTMSQKVGTYRVFWPEHNTYQVVDSLTLFWFDGDVHPVQDGYPYGFETCIVSHNSAQWKDKYYFTFCYPIPQMRYAEAFSSSAAPSRGETSSGGGRKRIAAENASGRKKTRTAKSMRTKRKPSVKEVSEQSKTSPGSVMFSAAEKKQFLAPYRSFDTMYQYLVKNCEEKRDRKKFMQAWANLYLMKEDTAEMQQQYNKWYRWELEYTQQIESNDDGVTIGEVLDEQMKGNQKQSSVLPYGWRYVLYIKSKAKHGDGNTWYRWVSIRRSRIAKAGNGLFAERLFPKKSLIGLYVGPYVVDSKTNMPWESTPFASCPTDKELTEAGLETTEYAVCVRDCKGVFHVVDPEPLRVGNRARLWFGCQYMNDFSKVYDEHAKRISAEERENTTIVEDGSIIARKKIEKDCEFWIKY